MPARTQEELPDGLKPYRFHGVDFEYKTGASQAVGTCPACGKEGKFNIHAETSKASCFVCKWEGNNYDFIKWLWEESRTRTLLYDELVADRGFLDDNALKAWGVARSILTDHWIIPGWSPSGSLTQLYRYVPLKNPKTGQWKRRVMLTPTLSQQVFRIADEFDSTLPMLFICEGPWDAIALWEMLGHVALKKGELVRVDKVEKSLRAKANVIAVPGANAFADAWSRFAADKEMVTLLYDNDHPGKHPKTGQPIAPAAFTGLQRATAALAAARKPPKAVSRLRWGDPDENGWEYDVSLPSGADIRDSLSPFDLEGRVTVLEELFKRIQGVPADWLAEGEKKKKKREAGLKAIPCSDWRTLRSAWRRAYKWTDGMEHAFTCMLACITSTKPIGSQLWIKVIGPPSCGKTSLCDGLVANKKHVLSVSNFTGFHSGYKMGDDDGDNSLISKLFDRTLIIKDGDTLLQLPNKDQILAQGRDLYDGKTSVHYKNKVHREYDGLRMTWILCGTNALRALDGSELGERFLDCVVMEGIDDEHEDEIISRGMMKAYKGMGYESSEDAESQSDPDKINAYRLTAGYVEHLRANAIKLFGQIKASESVLHRIGRFAKFVAYTRARPSKRHEERSERELAMRLGEQLLRMGMGLAAVLNKNSIDDEVLQRVARVAMDTGRGNTFDIVKLLYGVEEDKGLAIKQIALLSGQTESKTGTLLKFMKSIKAVESFPYQKTKGLKAEVRWRLTKTMSDLYEYTKEARDAIEST